MNKFDQLHMPLPLPPLPEYSECGRHGRRKWRPHVGEEEARREFETEGWILCTPCLLEINGDEP